MIHFVGAGPGAPDLITLRGARLLEAADVVIFAGSLVNPELLSVCKPTVRVYDSSRMALDEIVGVMDAAERAGEVCVRLHTGDPSLFGALREQADALTERGLTFDVVPGVSSLFAAAAALKLEYTVPHRSQSLIISRAPGRTPTGTHDDLAQLAATGAPLALFLSAGLLDEVQDQLLAGGRSPDTPCAIVVRASWPDEVVLRTRLATLARCGAEHEVTRFALVIVGDILLDHAVRSALYDPAFSHGYRSADTGEANA